MSASLVSDLARALIRCWGRCLADNTGNTDITDQPITWTNWWQHVNWLNTYFIIVVPMIGLVASYWVNLQYKTAIFAVLYYFFSGLGISKFTKREEQSHEDHKLLTIAPAAGYHRLWAHSSYKASLPLKIFLAAGGAASVEGSARWWSSLHRSHHRYTDTEKDPYSVRKGLLYSHLGWMVMKQNPRRIGRTDITDLNDDAVVVWQHRNYLKSVVTMALIVPTLICGFGWGDFAGGFVYGGILRM